MGGGPIIESPIMVSSPLHLTTSAHAERFVKSSTTPTGEFSRIHIDIQKTNNNDDTVTVPAVKVEDESGFFDTPLSDAGSEQSSLSDLVAYRTPLRSTIRKEGSVGSSSAKSVAFGDICTRSYSVVLGDHPCCSMGCALSLGWEYSETPDVSVDEYEAARAPRLTRENLRTTWDERRSILSDVSDCEVKRAQRKLHRERSCQRKVRNRTCAAFFQQDLPDACTAASV